MTRSAFILRGALAAGAAYGVGAAGPFVARALAQTDSGDIDILNFALGLEQLEAAFFAAAIKRANLPGGLKGLATEFGKQEQEHVDTLKQTVQQLGGKAAPPAKAKFNVRDRGAFLKTAIALEDLGVGAYNGAAPRLKTPDIVAAAGAIVQVEARHAAALRMRAGQDPAPDAFDPALTQPQVQARLKNAASA